MSPPHAADSDSTTDCPSTRNGELVAQLRAEFVERFAWPPALESVRSPLWDLGSVMDLARLSKVAADTCCDQEISFAIISREYLRTGLNWIAARRRLDSNNFLIIAGDRYTADTLDRQAIPNILAEIDESEFDTSFKSSTGFSAKGIAVSAFKFPVSCFLVKCGYSVVLSDADALWLRDPMPYLRSADIAFQRISVHPRAITSLWGFGACGGFISFRSSRGTVAFLERCIEENRQLFDDQVVMNLTLLAGDPHWHCEDPEWTLPDAVYQGDRSALQLAFAKYASRPIKGKLRAGNVHLLALPHDKFWRHELVVSPIDGMAVCHPNSPKDDLEKMRLFERIGLRFLSSDTAEPQ
jgi:hypothetical protein